MICQATVQHNYERAVSLINAIALAPFEVSEKQWTDHFKSGGDRIGKDNLQKLLDALHYCNVAREATFLNLSKSLQSLCISGTSTHQNPIACRDEALTRTPLNARSGELDDSKMANLQKLSVNLLHTEEEDDDIDWDPIHRDLNYAASEDELASNDSLHGNSEGIYMIEPNMGATDDSDGSELPSANQILERWKKA